MQCGLVDDETLDEGGAVVLLVSGSSVEAGGPARCEVALDPDAVPAGVGARSRGGVFIGAPWVVRCVHARSGLGEQASSHLVIRLMNFGSSARRGPCAVRGWSRPGSAAGVVQQTQACGLADGFASAGDAELGVDVAGVGAHRVHRDAELAGDGGATQVAVEQPQDVELALAERVDERLCRWPGAVPSVDPSGLAVGALSPAASTARASCAAG